MDPSHVGHFMNLSLAALQLEYVDSYLMHFPVGFQYLSDNELTPTGEDGQILIDHSTDLQAIWEAMQKLVDEGKTKAIGLSNCNDSQVERIWNSARIKPACLQVRVVYVLKSMTL